MGSGTYGRLHDPDFSFEERNDAHDDLDGVPEGGIQQAGKSLPEREGHLLRGFAKQLARGNPWVSPKWESLGSNTPWQGE